MKKVQAVNKEVMWDKSRIIMSKTNPKGIIEYANDVFIEVSGYEEFELMGKPHNMIRHPDMPKVIFKLLWDRIQKGENMHAVIKNMAKSGKYYWVITDFEVKVDEEGKIESYYAKRKAAPDDVIAKIGPLYGRLLQIEEASGMEASEKYFKGFLEEKEMSYDKFIESIIVQPEETKKGGFFASFFG